MGKIGRNEKCPCRSGKKYKHCCAKLPQEKVRELSPEERLKVTLMSGVEQVQASAMKYEVSLIELGVFILYSTNSGDAWLLEVTDSDCVQLVKGGEKTQPPINEDPQTIEIDWSHTFSTKAKTFEIKAYSDKTVKVLEDAPVKEIAATRKRILKKFTPEQLRQVHISQEEIK